MTQPPITVARLAEIITGKHLMRMGMQVGTNLSLYALKSAQDDLLSLLRWYAEPEPGCGNPFKRGKRAGEYCTGMSHTADCPITAHRAARAPYTELLRREG